MVLLVTVHPLRIEVSSHLQRAECLGAGGCSLETRIQQAVEGARPLISGLHVVVLTWQLRHQHSSSQSQQL